MRHARYDFLAFWATAPRTGLLLAGLAACVGCSSGAGSNGDKGGEGTGGQSNPPVTSTSPNAMEFVAAHNAVRAGVTEPAGYTGTWQALPAVAWSDTVAASAQQWADHLMSAGCGLQHANGTGYGENLAGGTHVSPQGAVDLWAAEKANYSYAPKYVFANNTGHYTQIVWRASTHIGCASAACAGSNVVVCRYDPPGNFIDAQIF